MSKINVNQKADIRAIMGAPGTGKSHYTKAEISKAKCVLIWDLEDEYTDVPALSLAQLPHQLHQGKSGGFKVRFVPSTDANKRQIEFDLFCRTAMAIGDLLLIVEELRFVTQPSKAPAGWAGVTLRGRKRGVRVIGTSQRPASIDKDFLGSATLIRCGALNYPEDRKAVAMVMGIDPEEVASLSGFSAILWTRTPRKVSRV